MRGRSSVLLGLFALILLMSSIVASAAAPEVTSVEIEVDFAADAVISREDVGEVLIVKAYFDEPIDPSTPFDFAFDPDVSATKVPNTDYFYVGMGLPAPHTGNYVAVAWEIADSNVDIVGVDVTVTGVESVDGDVQLPHTEASAFDVDQGPPQVTEVITEVDFVPDSVMGLNDVGKLFLIKAYIDDPIDSSTPFTFTYSADLSDTMVPNTDYAFVGSGLPAPYTGNYVCVAWEIADSGQQILGVDITVENVETPDGDVQLPHTESNVFDVEQYDPPEVTSVVIEIDGVPDTVIGQDDVGMTCRVTAYYDQLMDGMNSHPTFTFTPEVASTMLPGAPEVTGFQANDPGESFGYVQWTIVDSDDVIRGVDVTVSGALSASGEVQVEHTETDAFDVEQYGAEPPYISNVAIEVDGAPQTVINRTDLGKELRFTFTYNEWMDHWTVPGVVTFTPDVHATAGNPSGEGTFTGQLENIYLTFWELTDDGEEYLDVDISADGANDIDGIAQIPYSWNDAFTIDLKNPTVTSVTVDTEPVSEVDLTQEVTVNFSETMDTAFTPTIHFVGVGYVPLGTWTSQGGGWSSGDTVWIESFLLEDNDEETPVGIDVTGTQDLAGNPQNDYGEEWEFWIDTVKPEVFVTFGSDPIDEADLVQEVEINFSVPGGYLASMMTDGSADPVIVFSHGTWTPGAGSWAASSRWEQSFTVTDLDEELSYVTVDVSGTKDAAGNPQEPYAESPLSDDDNFLLDTTKPTITSITYSADPVTENDLTQTIVLSFREAMDTLVKPTVAITGITTPKSDSASGTWNTTSEYEVTLTLDDDNEEDNVLDVTVTGAQDLVGNVMEEHTETNPFSVDTRKPSVTSISFDTEPVSEIDLTQEVVVTFDEAIDTLTAPTIYFTDGIGPVGTWTSQGGSWSADDTVWTETFLLEDNDEELKVGIDILDAKDAAGNPQEDYGPDWEFFIDTVKPEAYVNFSVDPIYERDLVQEVTITFSAMNGYLMSMTTDGSADPVIAFSDGTWTPSPGTWTGLYEWTQEFTTIDLDQEIWDITIDVSGTKDAAGNPQEPYVPHPVIDNDNFDLDTVIPVIDNVVILNATVDTTACVKDGQDVTITARVMDQNLSPNVGTDKDNIYADLTDFGGAASVNPDSYAITGQGPTATWNLSGVTCTPSNGTVTIEIDAYDRLGNQAVQESDTITSDNIAPTIESISSTMPDGCYGIGDELLVTITFSEDVTLERGDLRIDFDSGGSAWIDEFGPQDSVTATYTIGSGDDDCDLSVAQVVLESGSLRDCPWNDADFTLPAAGSNDRLEETSDLMVDTTPPVIVGVDVDGPSVWLANENVDADCCTVTLDFAAQVTDSCSISYEDVDVNWALGSGSPTAVVENLTWARQPGQTDVDVVDIFGTVDVRCITGCPTDIVLTVTAVDCSGNEASPLVSTQGAMGQVNDVDAPTPYPDPLQHTYEEIRRDELEVRLDEFNVYRLLIRENTPERIDVLANDIDNCSGCGCCAEMTIDAITDAPDWGTATVEVPTGDCDGGATIRYAPDRGYIGPDSFSYTIRDACGNVSGEETVYLHVIPFVFIEDVSVTACSGERTEVRVAATDLWVDRDPVLIPFEFQIMSGPKYGVLTGDLDRVELVPPSLGIDPNSGALVPTIDFIEAAAVRLTYVSLDGYVGRDAVDVAFLDPFGNTAVGRVDLLVTPCERALQPIRIPEGDVTPIILPELSDAALAALPTAASLVGEADGMLYPDCLSLHWSDLFGRHVLSLDTSLLPLGAFRLTIPLDDLERVQLALEVTAEP